MKSPTAAVCSAATFAVVASAVMFAYVQQASAAPSASPGPSSSSAASSAPPSPPSAQPTAAPSAPAGITCGFIPFDSATLEQQVIGGGAHVILTVRGHNVSAGYTNQLLPVYYESRPAYRQVGVVGCGPRRATYSPSVYQLTLDMTTTRGTAGVEVVGAHRTQRVSVPGLLPPSTTPPYGPS